MSTLKGHCPTGNSLLPLPVTRILDDRPRVRMVHISDIHVFARHARWTWRDWLSKRLTGLANLKLFGRARRFRFAVDVLQVLALEFAERRPDFVIFSGDATCLGFEEELRLAAELLGVKAPNGLPGLAVPGNHDYYTHRCTGLFEHTFTPWMEGERIDNEFYPFARRVGPIWLIGLNSATPTRFAWDATGRVGSPQRERLRQLLALPHIQARPRVIVTHYPLRRANGRKEFFLRVLRDLREMTQVAVDGGVSLWLHGHLHNAYFHPRSEKHAFPVICAGSTTQFRKWSYFEYETDGITWKVERRTFDPKLRQFRSVNTFSFPLLSSVLRSEITSPILAPVQS